MSFRLKTPPPANPDDFERLCLRLLKAHWKCPTLEPYGRRGERQHGVDLIEISGADALRASQCKLYDNRKTLPPKVIRDEVASAKTFPFKLATYAICTTARISAEAQQAVISINQQHRQEGLFTVEFFAWDRLQDLLEEFPTIRDEIYKTLSGEAVQQFQSGISEINLRLTDLGTQMAATVQDSADGLHAEIDAGRDLIREGQPQAARLVLQRFRARRWDQCSVRHRYRLLANLGCAYLLERNFSEASRYFLEAAGLQPTDVQAAENQALAYYLTLPPNRAFDSIAPIRNAFPHSPRINAYWIATTPEEENSKDIERQLTPSDLATAEVAAALAARALSECDFQRAEELAALAVARRPEWSFPRFLKVRAGILRMMSAQSFSTSAQLNDCRSVIEPLSNALQSAIKEHDLNMQTLCLLERCQMHLILGDLDEAEADLLSARRLSPEDITVKRVGAELSLKKNKIDDAISELRQVSGNSDHPEIALLLSEILRKRGSLSDLEEATNLLTKLLQTPRRATPGTREYLASVLLQLLSQQQRWREYSEVCDSLTVQGVSPALICAFRARAEFLQERAESATVLAQEAASLLMSTAPPAETHWIAQVLSELGRHSEALTLWQRIASRTELTEYTRCFLGCAQRLGRDDLTLDLCAALRQNGVVNHDLILYEVQALEQYDVDGAIAALTSYLKVCPEDKIVRLRLSVIGTNWNRRDVVDAQPTVMPNVASTSVHDGWAAVYVMKLGGYPNEALAYAYELLRLHFNDPVAHRAYTFNLHPFEPHATVPEVKTVMAGCAVCYVNEYDSGEQWMIIEDSANPDMSRLEYSSEHPVAKALMGKQVGDKVLVSSSAIGDRAVVVQSITSKYVFRYHDSCSNWHIRFPDVPGVESFKVVRKDKDGKDEIDLTPMVISIERLNGDLQRLRELYRSSPMPIYMFGSARGKRAIQTTISMAQQEDMEIFCCAGTAEERDSALAALDTSGTWILEPSAVATILLLGLEDDLLRLPVNLVLSQGTAADFDEMLREDTLFKGESGFIVKHGSGIAFLSQSESAKAERVQSLTERMNKIKSKSRVAACMELAKVDGHNRELMLKVLGDGGAESIVLAAKPGHFLWTDDQRLSGFAKTEYGVKAGWTQVVLQWAAQHGYLSVEKFVASTARLIGFGYSFTSPSPAALIAAAQMAEWDKSRWPLSKALGQLGTESIHLRDAASLALAVMERAYRENILDERRRALAWALMDTIGARVGGIEIVQKIKGAIPSAFGLNVLGVVAAVSTIDAWLKSRPIRP